MKRILVPTDFSEHAEYALKVAAQIARDHDGEICLLHMLELPGQGNDAVGTSSDIPEIMFFMEKAREMLADLQNEPYLQGIEITELVQFERAFDGIIKTAKKNEVDLIVMGSHGASGFREMFIGSNTEKVVRTSDIPVLVIKREEQAFNPEKLVFASDFSDEIKKPFAKVVEFANNFNAQLQLVFINTPNDFRSTHAAEKMIHNFAAGFQFKNGYNAYVYNDVNVEKGILHFANSINADLIGMCTHGRKGLAHFFNGSISEDLVNHAVRPVITFKI